MPDSEDEGQGKSSRRSSTDSDDDEESDDEEATGKGGGARYDSSWLKSSLSSNHANSPKSK